jgi:hypothetical protein
LRISAFVVLATVAFAASAQGDAADRVQWQDSAAWACAKEVVVRPFPVTGPFKGTRSIPEYMRLFVDELGRRLRNVGLEVALATDDTAPTSADVIIRGEFVDLTTGSRAARFWVGFGAGKSKCHVRMHATRARDGRQIFSAEHERLSAFGLSKEELAENVTEVAGDLAQALAQNRGPCVAPGAGSSLVTASVPGMSSSGTAAVTIESTPANAEVSVDGNLIGTTPLSAYPMAAGTRAVEVSKKGFLTWRRNLAVQGGAATRLSAELEAGIDPPDALVVSQAGDGPRAATPAAEVVPPDIESDSKWEPIDVDGPEILLVTDVPDTLVFINKHRVGITSPAGLAIRLEGRHTSCVLVHQVFGGKAIVFRVGNAAMQSRVVIKMRPGEESR